MNERVSDETIEAMLAGCEGVRSGPWKYLDIGEVWASMDMVDDDDRYPLAEINPGHGELGEHIARCDPQTIAALLTELRELREKGE